MTDRDELEVLSPTPRTVAFRGQALAVKPLRLEQLSSFTTATRPILSRVVMAIGMLEEGAVLHTGAVLFDLMEQDAAALARALAVATDQDEAFIAGGELGEIAELAAAVVEVNEDFFSRRLPDLLERLRPAVARLPRRPRPALAPTEAPTPDGSTSSTSSAQGGTPAETS